jgi:hypothetical protein
LICEQLDQLEQLFVDAGLGGKLSECPHGIVGIRRQRLKIRYSFRACDIFLSLCYQYSDLL